MIGIDSEKYGRRAGTVEKARVLNGYSKRLVPRGVLASSAVDLRPVGGIVFGRSPGGGQRRRGEGDEGLEAFREEGRFG